MSHQYDIYDKVSGDRLDTLMPARDREDEDGNPIIAPSHTDQITALLAMRGWDTGDVDIYEIDAPGPPPGATAMVLP